MRNALVAALALMLPVIAVAQLPEWDFTREADPGWRPNQSLRAPAFTDEGLVTALEGVDPWLAGPPIEVGAEEARYLQVRLRVGHHGGGSVYFTTDASPEFKQANMVRFRLRPGGEWQELMLDMGAHPAWTGTITRLRLDPIDVWPNIPAGQPIIVSQVRLLPPDAVPPDVRLLAFHAGPRWRVAPGEVVEVRARLANRGGRATTPEAVALELPDWCSVQEAPGPLPTIAPDEEVELRWSVRAERPGAGAVSLSVRTAEGASLVAARRLFCCDGWSTEQALALETAFGRIVVATGADGVVNPLVLQTRAPDGAWADLAVIPSLATVMVRRDDGSVEAVELCPDAAQAADDMTGAEAWSLRAHAQDSVGGTWTATLELRPNAEGLPLVATRLVVECDRAAQVWRVDGPTVLLEPATEGAQQGALLGGLEWLEGGEESWNPAADRSDLRIRYRPHVNRIAFPLMAVSREAGRVGWLWEAGEDPPGAVWGLPTREVTGREEGELGLFRPAIRTTEGENDDFGMAPVDLAPGGAVVIEADLLLSPPEPDLAQVCGLWLERFGLPAHAPLPRGDWRAELDFTLDAFLDTLWLPEENAWLNGIGPSRNVGRFGPFLASVLMGARLLEGERAESCRARLEETWGSPEGYRGNELPWYEGSLIANYGRRLGGYAESLERQGEDGGWTFADWLALRRMEDTEKYAALGDLERSEVGFGARYAASLLRFARVTGDPRAREAGLDALRWLAGFRVPRAAQCWEVPAHAPDIVAAGDAVVAFVEGYLLTGEEAHLQEAEAWAMRGLPFIQMWGDPQIPGMLYGSIPVLGATWYTGAWYGRPVQWCGLAYAQALGHLIDAGRAEPWAGVRDGLLASGAMQQFTEPHRRALIPDAIDLAAGGLAADYWVPPYYHALALSHRLGAPPGPQTALAGEIRVSAMGQVQAELDGATLNVEVAFPLPGAHHVLIAGIVAVDAVLLNGAPLAHAEDLTGPEGWAFLAERRLLEVRLADPAQARITLTGVEAGSVGLLPAR